MVAIVAKVAEKTQQGLVEVVQGDGVDAVESAEGDEGYAFEGRGQTVFGHACG